MRPAIQLYGLREMDAPLPAVLDRVGETAVEGVEFADLGDAAPETVAAALDRNGLAAVGAHVDFETVAADPAGVVDTWRRVGCETLIVPFLPPERFESPEAAAATAADLAALAARVRDCGARLAYHNHDHEFVAADGGTGLDALAGSAAGPSLELDAGWAAAAGADPAALLARYDDVPLVHLKDVTADGTPVELGEGCLDAAATARAARETGVEWLVYEHDDPADPAASLRHGAKRVARFCE